MPIEQTILFSICLVVISALITYTAYRKFHNHILKYSPSFISLLGTLLFGIGPYFFHYAQGVSSGLFCLFLGIFFGIFFITSIATIVYVKVKK